MANERQTEMWINGVIYGRIMSLYNEVKLWDQKSAVCSSKKKDKEILKILKYIHLFTCFDLTLILDWAWQIVSEYESCNCKFVVL